MSIAHTSFEMHSNSRHIQTCRRAKQPSFARQLWDPYPVRNIPVIVTSIATPITVTECNDHARYLDAKPNNHRELNSFAQHGPNRPRKTRLA